jgi:starch phosphorylase
MKVLVNGGLDLSTLDGWWAEAYAPEYGWALGDCVEQPDDDAQEAQQLYTLLESEVVPAFYDRDAKGIPRRWISRVRSSMASLTPRFSSVRMLQEYVERAYVPCAASFRRRAEADATTARALDRWSHHLARHWRDIRFGELSASAGSGRLSVSVPVFLGAIAPDAVRVELYADHDGDERACARPMTCVEPVQGEANAFVYTATVETSRPASHFTPRVVPCHSEACVPIELPLVAWQR